MSTAERTIVAGRWVGVDRLRGLAVVLMVLDHGLVASGDPAQGDLLRRTITRLSLPLFCVLAGSLSHGRRPGRRLLLLAGAGAALTPASKAVGLGQPDILLLLAGALVVVQLAPDAWLPAVAAAAIVQPTTWPVGWSGYEPGTVVALVALGSSVYYGRLAQAGQALPAALGWVGRRPLAWYCGHVTLFGLLAAVG